MKPNSLGASPQAAKPALVATRSSRKSVSTKGFDPARGAPKIRLFINHAHIALVLRVKRDLCVGEEVRAA